MKDMKKFKKDFFGVMKVKGPYERIASFEEIFSWHKEVISSFPWRNILSFLLESDLKKLRDSKEKKSAMLQAAEGWVWEMKKGLGISRSELKRRWRKLLNTASFEPLPFVENFMKDGALYKKKSGKSLPHHSVLLSTSPIGNILIRNAIRDSVKDIILEERSVGKVSRLQDLLENPKVTKDLLNSVVSKQKLVRIVDKCEREFASRNREDLLSQVNDIHFWLSFF